MNILTFGRYPSLRVAYIDEVEVTNQDRSKKINEKVYYSCLVMANLPKSNSSDPVHRSNLDEVKVHLTIVQLTIFYEIHIFSFSVKDSNFPFEIHIFSFSVSS